MSAFSKFMKLLSLAGGVRATNDPVTGGIGFSMTQTGTLLCAAIGDSRFANALQNQSAGVKQNVSWSNQGALFWLGFFANHKIDLPWSYDLAVSGQTTAQILASVPQAVALNPKPRVCFINGLTNSLGANPTLDQVNQSFADITAAAQQLAMAGIVPVIELDTPRTTASWTATASKLSAAYNAKMRAWCRRSGVRLADCEAQFVQSSGEPVAGYNVADGVHQAQSGAVVRALALLAAVQDLLPSFIPGKTGSPLDTYDSANNPNGNILTNGLMTGSAGANAGTGASGSGPTSWTNQVVSGTMTAAVSKESPRTDGALGDRAVIALSSVTVAGQHRFAPSSSLPAANFTAGDIVVGEVDIEIAALSGIVDYIQLNCFDFDGSSGLGGSVTGKNTFATGLNPMPPVPMPNNTGSGNLLTTLKGRLRTAPIVLGQGGVTASFLFRIETGLQAGAAVTFKVGDAVLRKVGTSF